MVELDSTCFINNTAHGNGLITAFSKELPALKNNYGVNNKIEFLTTLECEFVALVNESDSWWPNLACGDFDATECSVS